MESAITTPARSNIVLLGSAHGRFQVFHNEHLEYILAAKHRCTHLLVGLTAYDRTAVHAAQHGLHRLSRFDNPLSYFERASMVRDALRGSGVADRDFSVIPFPVETPERLPEFAPLGATCFTTIREDWNRQKIRLLHDVGYQVEVVIEGVKTISGSDVRQRILSGDPSWRTLVPPSTAALVERFHLAERLRSLVREPRPR